MRHRRRAVVDPGENGRVLESVRSGVAVSRIRRIGRREPERDADGIVAVEAIATDREVPGVGKVDASRIAVGPDPSVVSDDVALARAEPPEGGAGPSGHDSGLAVAEPGRFGGVGPDEVALEDIRGAEETHVKAAADDVAGVETRTADVGERCRAAENAEAVGDDV